MIQGGSPTIYVSDMDRAVRFYTQSLGLKLLFRAGNHYAQVDAGRGFSIGLHPASPGGPKPGAHGAIHVGFMLSAPLDDVVKQLTAKGVKFRGPIKDDPPVRFAYFDDPDGNDLYLVEMNGTSSSAH